jgi:hypothetical protein
MCSIISVAADVSDKPLNLSMKIQFVLTPFLFVIMAVPGQWTREANAIEVFVNGEEFSSFKDYQDKKNADEKTAAESTAKPFSSLSNSVKKPEPPVLKKGLPFDFDPAKGKTVVITQDGSAREEPGVAPLPEWMVFDPAKGKTIEIKTTTVSPPAKGPESMADQPVDDISKTPRIVHRGRIAGVQPPLAQVVEQFQASKGTRAAQRISSAYELEEGLKKAAQGTDGVVLLIAGPGKVRLYDLKGTETAANATDGQKTR